MRCSRGSIRIICWLICVVIFQAAPASAKKGSAEAKAHWQAGVVAYRAGEFANAAEEFRQAYKLSGNPEFLYNVAQSHRLAKNWEQSIYFYKSFLSAFPNTPERGRVEEHLRVLEEQKQKAAQAAVPVVEPAPEPQVNPSHVELVQRDQAPIQKEKPTYKKWWPWTIVGVAVVGVSLGVGLGVGLSQPKAPLGSHEIFALGGAQ